MDIEIRSQSGHHVELATPKCSAYIGYMRSLGYVQVICLNSAHKAWKGHGRQFAGFSKAQEGYKSSAMKAMIALAEKLLG